MLVLQVQGWTVLKCLLVALQLTLFHHQYASYMIVVIELYTQ